MYSTIKVEDLNKNPRKYRRYKLCYIDDISQTIWEMTPESKKFTEGWGEKEWTEWNQSHIDPVTRQYIFDDKIKYWDAPNPNFIKGTKEKFAYFTDIDLKDQWGDDWDDAPYEHNAECPYDDNYVEIPIEEQRFLGDNEYAVSLTSNPDGSTKRLKKIEHNIVKIPFAILNSDVKEPKDFTSDGCNSHFAVNDINSGLIPWLYLPSRGKNCNGIAIHAGCNPIDFIEKLNKINEL